MIILAARFMRNKWVFVHIVASTLILNLWKQTISHLGQKAVAPWQKTAKCFAKNATVESQQNKFLRTF